jgi:hypothetical protein
MQQSNLCCATYVLRKHGHLQLVCTHCVLMARVQCHTWQAALESTPRGSAAQLSHCQSLHSVHSEQSLVEPTPRLGSVMTPWNSTVRVVVSTTKNRKGRLNTCGPAATQRHKLSRDTCYPTLVAEGPATNSILQSCSLLCASICISICAGPADAPLLQQVATACKPCTIGGQHIKIQADLCCTVGSISC